MPRIISGQIEGGADAGQAAFPVGERLFAGALRLPASRHVSRGQALRTKTKGFCRGRARPAAGAGWAWKYRRKSDGADPQTDPCRRPALARAPPAEEGAPSGRTGAQRYARLCRSCQPEIFPDGRRRLLRCAGERRRFPSQSRCVSFPRPEISARKASSSLSGYTPFFRRKAPGILSGKVTPPGPARVSKSRESCVGDSG